MTTPVPTTEEQLKNLPLAYSPMPNGVISEEFLSRQFSRANREPVPITYELTRDPGLLFQYFQMRENMFIRVWGLKHFSGQKDEFDDRSDIIIARIGNQCIGGCRLTYADASGTQRLPMEKDELMLANIFPELQLQDGRYLEVSRLAILPEFQNSVVMLELTRQMFKCAAAKQSRYAFALAPIPLARNYRRTTAVFGGPVWRMRSDIQVPDREEYEGIRMVLSTLDLAQIYRADTVKPAEVKELALQIED